MPEPDGVRRAARRRCGADVDVWETTYLQRLTGPDPVLHWISGTALRPVRDALPPDEYDGLPRRAGPAAARGLPARAGRHDLVPVPPDLRGGPHALTAVQTSRAAGAANSGA